MFIDRDSCSSYLSSVRSLCVSDCEFSQSCYKSSICDDFVCWIAHGIVDLEYLLSLDRSRYDIPNYIVSLFG